LKPGPFDILAPLVNATYLTTLTLGEAPISETFRKMADNYTCLQDFQMFDSPNWSDVEYFLEKQCETLTSLKISTSSTNPLGTISKCRNLKILHLYLNNEDADTYLDGLENLSKLRCLHLSCLEYTSIKYGLKYGLGHILVDAKLRHLNEIYFNTDEVTDR
jgi:hypothetical protein